MTLTSVLFKSSILRSAFIWSGSMLSKKKILGRPPLSSFESIFQYGFKSASHIAIDPSALPPMPRTSTLSKRPSTIAAYSLTYHTVSSLYPRFIHWSHCPGLSFLKFKSRIISLIFFSYWLNTSSRLRPLSCPRISALTFL